MVKEMTPAGRVTFNGSQFKIEKVGRRKRR